MGFILKKKNTFKRFTLKQTANVKSHNTFLIFFLIFVLNAMLCRYQQACVFFTTIYFFSFFQHCVWCTKLYREYETKIKSKRQALDLIMERLSHAHEQPTLALKQFWDTIVPHLISLQLKPVKYRSKSSL